MIRILNALWILVYCAIISTAFSLQIFQEEEPCPLCYLQRNAMLLICLLVAMNLWRGVRLLNYALAIVVSILGGAIAIRQILLHTCPGFTEFGVPFLGLELYTWSFLTFIGSLSLIALLLALYKPEQEMRQPLTILDSIAIGWLGIVVAGNIISVYLSCGFGPCA